MDQWMNPDEGEKKGGSSIRVTELGEEDPTVIASVMYTIHRLDRREREAYRMQAVRDAGSFKGHLCA